MSKDKRIGEYEAFTCYYRLGDARSIGQVNQLLRQRGLTRPPSLATLKVWSSKYHWVKRCEDIDGIVQDRIQSRLVDDVLADKAKYRAIIQECIDSFIKRFREGLINVRNPEELIKLINLDLQLVGERIGQDEIRVTIERAK